MYAVTGKNRPLDEEEVQFVDALEAASREREQQQQQQELDALEAYQLVRQKPNNVHLACCAAALAACCACQMLFSASAVPLQKSISTA